MQSIGNLGREQVVHEPVALDSALATKGFRDYVHAYMGCLARDVALMTLMFPALVDYLDMLGRKRRSKHSTDSIYGVHKEALNSHIMLA